MSDSGKNNLTQTTGMTLDEYVACSNQNMNEKHDQEFINIAILDNIIEAQLVGSILKEHNIPHRIRSFHDTAYDGLFQFQKGWGALWAPVSSRGEILEILHDVRSKEFDI